MDTNYSYEAANQDIETLDNTESRSDYSNKETLVDDKESQIDCSDTKNLVDTRELFQSTALYYAFYKWHNEEASMAKCNKIFARVNTLKRHV